MLDINPARIYRSYKKKAVDKNDAIKALKAVIENSEEELLRCRAIKYYGRITEASEAHFKFLEQLFLSDTSVNVRLTSGFFLFILFPEDSIRTFKWAIMHDTSPYFLHGLFKTCKMINLLHSTELLKALLERSAGIFGVVIEEAEFFLEIEAILEQKWDDFECKVGFLVQFRWFDPLEVTHYHDWNVLYAVINRRIRAVSCRNLGLTYIPRSIALLSRIRYLNLSRNDLTSLPKWLSVLARLRWLNLSGNDLRHIPLHLRRLTKLKYLDLADNVNFDTRSPGLLEFVHRRYKERFIKEGVDSGEAEVMGVFEVIGEVFLKDEIHQSVGAGYKINGQGHVTVSVCREAFRLVSLPDQIHRLSHLEKLSLRGIHLKKIPHSLSKLTSLRELRLQECWLREFPSAVIGLKNLEKLDLRGNHFTIHDIPPSIMERKQSGALDLYL
jgi:hypothetical protein